MAKKEHEKRRAKKANLLGKVLMLLPVSCALLYPLYLGIFTLGMLLMTEALNRKIPLK